MQSQAFITGGVGCGMFIILKNRL